MVRNERKVNRGPAAAAGNRQALLDAARRVFTERGFHAPLSAVASAAGVGQAVLYRHFPTRLALAYAVFEDNWAAFETLAVDPDPHAFERMWQLFVEKTLEDAAFIEMVVDARRQVSGEDQRRMTRLLAAPLARAQAAGLVDASLTADDVMLAHRLVYGIAATAVDSRAIRSALRRALAVVGSLPPITGLDDGGHDTERASARPRPGPSLRTRKRPQKNAAKTTAKKTVAKKTVAKKPEKKTEQKPVAKTTEQKAAPRRRVASATKKRGSQR